MGYTFKVQTYDYRKGEFIDIKAVSKSRTKQNVSGKKKKTTKRKRKS